MASKDRSKPNIVVIMTDDQGAWAMGCAGNKEIKTPNLDHLAKTGTRFENFFCTCPVCSPARASFLTGRIPSQHGVHDFIRSGNINICDLGPEMAKVKTFAEETVAIEYLKGMNGYTDFLADSGYSCGLSGKWHLGDSLRPQKGFSHWFTIVRGGCGYYKAELVRDGRVYMGKEYITDIITEDALEYLDMCSKDDAPFYLSVHYTAPHSPWDSNNHPKKYLGLYEDCPFMSCPDEPVHPWQINTAPVGEGEKRKEILKGYYAAVTAMDTGVGCIINKIEEMGLRENTLIVFTSDNGMNMGHHGIWGKGNGTFPQNMFDTAVKVPFIVSRPGHVEQDKVCDELLSQYDFKPTLLDYIGIENPEAESLPGKSFAAVLRGEESKCRDNIVVFDEYGPVRMIRSREWKYIHRYPYGPHELYDLKNDPDEKYNIVNDASAKTVVEEMRYNLAQWFDRYVNPRIDGTKEAVTGKGQLCMAGLWSEGRQTYGSDMYFYHDSKIKKVD